MSPVFELGKHPGTNKEERERNRDRDRRDIVVEA